MEVFRFCGGKDKLSDSSIMMTLSTYKIPVFALLLLLWAAGSATGSTVKKHHVRKAHRAPVAAFDSTLVREDIVDTCDFDPLTDIQRSMIEEMNRWTEVRYHRGGLTKLGVDCSGFTTRIFRDGAGIELPRTSREQAHSGEKVDRGSLSFGDLIFFCSRSKKRITHVGIYLADGKFIHSARKHGVGVSSLSDGYFRRHFVTARRVLSDSPDLSAIGTE